MKSASIAKKGMKECGKPDSDSILSSNFPISVPFVHSWWLPDEQCWQQRLLVPTDMWRTRVHTLFRRCYGPMVMSRTADCLRCPEMTVHVRTPIMSSLALRCVGMWRLCCGTGAHRTSPLNKCLFHSVFFSSFQLTTVLREHTLKSSSLEWPNLTNQPTVRALVWNHFGSTNTICITEPPPVEASSTKVKFSINFN